MWLNLKMEFQEYRGERYWVGTYGVLVHESLESCFDEGGYNRTYRDISKRPSIIINRIRILNKEQWLEKLAFSRDGLLFYKENPPKFADLIRDEKPCDSTYDWVKFRILSTVKEDKKTIKLYNTKEISEGNIIEKLEKDWFNITQEDDSFIVSW